MTLEEYLLNNFNRTDPYPVIDHVIRASVDPDGNVSFYIHSHGVNGDTLDFVVVGNTLFPKS